MIRDPSDSPVKLLQAAQTLITRPDSRTAGVWPRAAAHLARQALEGLLDEVWKERAPGTESASTRAQLICLPSYLGDHDLARHVTYTWNALSHACHHHCYELAPTAAELRGWMEVIERLRAAIDGSGESIEPEDL